MVQISNKSEEMILIVDDEINVLQSYEITLNSAGIENLILCSDSRKVKEILEKKKINLILLDLTMPHISGKDILEMTINNYPGIPVIILTGNMELETAVESMKAGAADYIVKPVEGEKLIASVEHVLELGKLKKENKLLKQKLLEPSIQNRDLFSRFNSGNRKMRSIFRYTEAIGGSPEPVLITGETGVGKELMARTIHDLSKRPGNLVSVSIAGLDDNMLSDTLFGHRKGAFTDAVGDRIGLIEEASGGTLFLDEIGDMSIAAQVKLLRVIQEKEFFRIGNDYPQKTDVRIVVATNRNLQEMMNEGKFRKDLFFRLEVHGIELPPLRERRDDIPLLIDEFIREAGEIYNKNITSVPKEIYPLLKNYHFPGNIRELRSLILNAVSSNRGKILSLETIRKSIQLKSQKKLNEYPENNIAESYDYRFPRPLPTLDEASMVLINKAIEEAEGNQTIAAGILGITRQTLSKKIKGCK